LQRNIVYGLEIAEGFADRIGFEHHATGHFGFGGGQLDIADASLEVATLLSQIVQALEAAHVALAARADAVGEPVILAHDLAVELGSYLIGRVLTQGVIIAALKHLGVRLSAQQAAKFAPLVGQAASAALSGWMFKRLCDRHLLHCQQIRSVLPQLPVPVIDIPASRVD